MQTAQQVCLIEGCSFLSSLMCVTLHKYQGSYGFPYAGEVDPLTDWLDLRARLRPGLISGSAVGRAEPSLPCSTASSVVPIFCVPSHGGWAVGQLCHWSSAQPGSIRHAGLPCTSHFHGAFPSSLIQRLGWSLFHSLWLFGCSWLWSASAHFCRAGQGVQRWRGGKPAGQAFS